MFRAKGRSGSYSPSGLKSPPKTYCAKPCKATIKFLDVLTISDIQCPGNALKLKIKLNEQPGHCLCNRGAISSYLPEFEALSPLPAPVGPLTFGNSPSESGASPRGIPDMRLHSGPWWGNPAQELGLLRGLPSADLAIGLWPLWLSPARASGNVGGGAKPDSSGSEPGEGDTQRLGPGVPGLML